LGRRGLLSRSSFVGLGLLLGCDDEELAPCCDGSMAEDACGDAFVAPHGEAMRLAGPRFEDEAGVPFHELVGEGWDGRLFTDLSALDADALVVPNERFYVRTRYPDRIDPREPWSVSVTGLVTRPTAFALDDLYPGSVPQGIHLLECSGNSDGGAFGLISAAEWSGIPVGALLARTEAAPAATRVLISGFDEHSVPSRGGHSTPGASWIFTFEELADAFLATHMNGEPLPADHGAPLRLLVPGWYGCCCIKWVNEIVLVNEQAAATSQMIEFAQRTHQTAAHALARDYRPARMDRAALPVRIEKWLLDGELVYRIVGIAWGGETPSAAPGIVINGGPRQAVTSCTPPTTRTWSLWSYVWRPPQPGRYLLAMHFDDGVPQRRLDQGWYEREVLIDEV
jgi:DMSO/TMAO reductase YedYZ molybdopterin-dependent catalytic subunit